MGLSQQPLTLDVWTSLTQRGSHRHRAWCIEVRGGRQQRAVHPALEWRDLRSNPISPPPTSSVALHKLFKFILGTYLHLLDQGQWFWTQSCYEMVYEMHWAQCPAPGRATLSNHSPPPRQDNTCPLSISACRELLQGSKVTQEGPNSEQAAIFLSNPPPP